MSDLYIAIIQACLVSALSPEPIKCGILEDSANKYETIQACSEQKDVLLKSIGQILLNGTPAERIQQFKLRIPWTFYCIKESQKEEFFKKLGIKEEKPGQDI